MDEALPDQSAHDPEPGSEARDNMTGSTYRSVQSAGAFTSATDNLLVYQITTLFHATPAAVFLVWLRNFVNKMEQAIHADMMGVPRLDTSGKIRNRSFLSIELSIIMSWTE